MQIDIRCTKLYKALPFLNWSKDIIKVALGSKILVYVGYITKRNKVLEE